MDARSNTTVDRQALKPLHGSNPAPNHISRPQAIKPCSQNPDLYTFELNCSTLNPQSLILQPYNQATIPKLYTRNPYTLIP